MPEFLLFSATFLYEQLNTKLLYNLSNKIKSLYCTLLWSWFHFMDIFLSGAVYSMQIYKALSSELQEQKWLKEFAHRHQKMKNVPILKYIHLTKQESPKQGERVNRVNFKMLMTTLYSVLILCQCLWYMSSLLLTMCWWVSHPSLFSSREHCVFFDRSVSGLTYSVQGLC